MVKKSKDSENIRVVVRTRPLLDDEKERGEKESVRLDVASGQAQVHHNIGDPDVWTFDAVYNNSFSQRDIYRQEVAPLIDAVMNGYNATVFAYGQSGSGKTHTMTGRLGDPTYQGMMPQAVEHLFKEVKDQTSSSKSFKIKLSYLELYNGNARDLLQRKQVTLEIKENLSKNFYVKGAEVVEVKSAAECVQLFREGTERRQTATTSLNEQSSRSHSLLVIVVEQYDFEQDATAPIIMSSKINLVDLAGSERQTKTGAAGETLKEGCNINLSLSALATVIDTIVKGGKHIPYRSSPLTKLLKDSLGGNSKTVMFANIGPSERNTSETISTLRFAERAKQIENKPVKNLDPKDAKIAELLSKIEDLQHKLGKGGVNLDEEEKLHERIEQLEIENQHLRGSTEKDTIDLEEQLKEKESTITKLNHLLEESQKHERDYANERQLLENKVLMENECVVQLKQLITEFFKKVCSAQQYTELKMNLQDREEDVSDLVQDDESGSNLTMKDIQSLFDGYVVLLPKWIGLRISPEEMEKEINKLRQQIESEQRIRISDLERERDDLLSLRESDTRKINAESDLIAKTHVELQNSKEENAKLLEKIKRDQEKFKTKLEKLKQDLTLQKDEYEATITNLRKEVKDRDSCIGDLKNITSQGHLDEAKVNFEQERMTLTHQLQESELRAQSLQSAMTEMEVLLRKKGVRMKSKDETVSTSIAEGTDKKDARNVHSSQLKLNEGMMILSDDDDELVRHIQRQVRLQSKLYELRQAQHKQFESLLAAYAQMGRDRQGTISEEKRDVILREANNEKRKEIEELSAKFQATQEQLVKKVNRKLQEVSEERTALEEENLELKEQNEKYTSLVHQTQVELQMNKSNFEKKQLELETELKLKENEIARLRKEIETSRLSLEQQNSTIAEYAELTTQHARLQDQYSRTEASLKEKIVTLDNNRQMLKWSNSLLEQEKQNARLLETRIKEGEQRIRDCEAHYREELIESSNKLVQISNRRLDDQAAQFQQQLSDEGEKQKLLREKLRKAKSQTQKVKQKYDELVLENEVLQMHLEEAKVSLLKIIRQQQQQQQQQNTGAQVADAFARPTTGSFAKR